MSTITGTYFDNYLYGGAGDDYIQGLGGYDYLFGNAGNDTLVGSDPWVWDSGAGEYDTLSGGAGADTFILGDSYEAYYQGFGFATITDFNWAEGDKIQVFGSINDYTLSPYGNGVDILYQGDLIGFVENTYNVIPSEDFIFV
ncbi:MAG: hypothetical protein F6J89_16420 [Symploca sp. SIO1C4]|uniref:Calcium-binding protein n=1 Tax=Symploca sp. SIO1C4 TaxID=2607765 RepID=A0A6B3NIX6_9CYAN|nr:hypothetical protein [Symploca sp. SIO1C4]